MTNLATNENHAEQQAQMQLESIIEMVNALEAATDDNRDDAEQAIQESPLSVEVRSEWHTVGSKVPGGQYKILLCTGGPAVQIIGELDEYCQPENATLQYQDWGTPWTNYRTSSKDEAAMVTYASQFYFEE
jgi:hypothetical protein